MKYFSLFSGIGAFEKALQRLEIPYDLVGYSEIDKYASKAYSVLQHVPESMNFGDIIKINENELPDDIDLITYGFPCQDISIAGSKQGLFNEDGTQTRSGLFFDALRIIDHCKPKIAIAENVKNLTSDKFKEQFNIVLNSLEQAGYNNYWKVLNAADFGIPQSRQRVFIVSIRKDIDTGIFEFPVPFELQKTLKDVIQPPEDVDEKYFVKPEIAERLAPQLANRDISKTMNNIMFLGNIYPTKTRVNPNQGRVYHPDGLSPTLNCSGGGNRQPYVLTNYCGGGRLIIRKYTPRDCLRLMGFNDADVDALIEAGISDTQLFKLAGNSIVVDVAECLFCQIMGFFS